MLKKVLIGFLLLVVAIIVVTSVIQIGRERTETVTITEKIEKASKKQEALIQSSLDDGLELKRTLAIKSGRHRLAYYVGAKIHGRGVGRKLGVWLVTGAMSRPKVAYSVNEVAHKYSGLKKGTGPKNYTTPEDPEVFFLKSRLEVTWWRLFHCFIGTLRY